MDISTMVRAGRDVTATWVDNEKGEVIAKQPCRIYIPVVYVDKKLAFISEDVQIIGVYAVALEDGRYGVSTTAAMLTIVPDTTNTVKIGDESYYEFVFEKGSVVIAELDLVKNDTMAYNIYNHFQARGNIPWFLNGVDVANIYSSLRKHAGVSVASSASIYHLLAAEICRDPNDRTKLFRYTLNSREGWKQMPAYAGIKNIQYSSSGVVAKFLGPYFPDNVTAALVNPSDKIESIEELLRK